ncbi:ST7 protein [Chitinispirillum alkaliphilum]|nr:ST7 protein [Chitinispirillum alkaliphilum]
MITIRMQDKLAVKIKETYLNPFSEHDNSPYVEWYAGLFTVRRHQYIILTNASTLFSVVLIGKGVTDCNNFLHNSFVAISEMTQEFGCQLIFERIISRLAEDVKLTSIGDPLVTDGMDLIISALKTQNDIEEMSAYEMGVWVNTKAWDVLGGCVPADMFINNPGSVLYPVVNPEASVLKSHIPKSKKVKKAAGNQLRSQSFTFTRQLRAGAYGWKSSALAASRIAAAVKEIKGVAKKDPSSAAMGVTIFLEKCWRAIEHIDSSSGKIGIAVSKAIAQLALVFGNAPLSQRESLLKRIWSIYEDEDIGYYDVLGDYWPQLCNNKELASLWADKLLPVVTNVLSGSTAITYFKGTSVCLSCLLYSERYEEIIRLIDPKKVLFSYLRYRSLALVKIDKVDVAVRELDEMDQSESRYYGWGQIARLGEEILLESGRAEEAYRRYAIGANMQLTGVATFNALRKKYPEIDPGRIIQDLIDTEPGNERKFFAAARKAGRTDLAQKIAEQAGVEPKTLVTACKEETARSPKLAFFYGMTALRNYAQGMGYDVFSEDIRKACRIAETAARAAGCEEEFRDQLADLIVNDKSPGQYFSSALKYN